MTITEEAGRRVETAVSTQKEKKKPGPSPLPDGNHGERVLALLRKCKCELCSEFARQDHFRRSVRATLGLAKEEAAKLVVPPRRVKADIRHGEYSGFCKGCRCEACKQASRSYINRNRLQNGLKERTRKRIGPDPSRRVQDNPFFERDVLNLRHELRMYFQRKVGRSNAEDAVQETIFRLFKIQPEYKERIENIRHYAFRVASHLASEIKTEAENDAEVVIFDSEVFEDLDGKPFEPLVLGIDVEEAEFDCLEYALVRVRASYKAAFISHFMNGLGSAEIAAKFDLTKATAKKYLIQGKAEVLALLAQQNDAA